MPSHLHETLVEMFRHRPSLAVDLLVHGLGVELPAYDRAAVDAGELPELTPTEYRADAVVVLGAGSGPVLAVVVEVQLGRDRCCWWCASTGRRRACSRRSRSRMRRFILMSCSLRCHERPVATWRR